MAIKGRSCYRAVQSTLLTLERVRSIMEPCLPVANDKGNAHQETAK